MLIRHDLLAERSEPLADDLRIFPGAGPDLTAPHGCVVRRDVVRNALIQPLRQGPAHVSHRDVFIDGEHAESVLFVKRSCHVIRGAEAQIVAAFLPGGVFGRADQQGAEAVMAVPAVHPELGQHRPAPEMDVHDAAADDVPFLILRLEDELLLLGVRLRRRHGIGVCIDLFFDEGFLFLNQRFYYKVHLCFPL